MSEMIIPSLAARKAARKKSQLAGGAEMPMATSFVEPISAPNSALDNAPGAQPEAQIASPAASEAPTPAKTDAQETMPQSPSLAVDATPQATPRAEETKRPEASTISIQSIFPSPLEIEKVAEKSKTTPVISKELLAKMARELGYELAQPKREFTKHTYSVTPHHKETMKRYVDVLGMAMQDAVCEAFDLFFAKHQAEFENVRKAKGK